MSRRGDYDAIVVGGGHNGLVCACYLARAGYRTLVVEARDVLGGAAATEELFPGFRLDTASVAHVLIRRSGVPEELDLAAHGLNYLEMDPWGFAPFPDGRSVTFYRDVDRTCQSIAAVSPSDADAYYGFVRLWSRLNEALLPSFLAPPQPLALASAVATRAPIDVVRLLGRHGAAELARLLLTSYGSVLAQTFASDYVRGPLARIAATVGTPPGEVGASNLLGWHALWHSIGVWRPRGGSGGLAEALARCLRRHGGEARAGCPVRRLLVREGCVEGVELADGERVTARTVVAATHVQTALLDLLPPHALAAGLRRRLAGLRVSSTGGVAVCCAADELPSYAAAPGAGEQHRGVQILCPSPALLQRAYDTARLGHPAGEPAVYVVTASALDQSLAPPGRHTVYIWGQYYPYRLAGEHDWEGLRERVADDLVARVGAYAPNLPGAIRARYVETPVDLERRFGLRRGNCMHLDLTLDQMFTLRPLPELSSYRTPVKGLYLTGASTHPIGGVTGMPGRNAARVILSDLERPRRLWQLGAAAAATAAGAAWLLRQSGAGSSTSTSTSPPTPG